MMVMLGAVTSLALAGCSAPANEVESSPAPTQANECKDAMFAAAAIPADQEADAELEATASACRTVDEWIEAVQEYPAAYGMNELTDADMPLYIQSLCYGLESTPMCVDAEANGYLD